MAGTLVVNEYSDWLPATWVFDGALNDIASHIEANSALRNLLLESRSSVSQAYLDLQQMDSQSFVTILKATENAIDSVKSRGPSSFATAEFFDGYLTQLEYLRDLLARDARAKR
jgi:hypothetical protein